MDVYDYLRTLYMRKGTMAVVDTHFFSMDRESWAIV